MVTAPVVVVRKKEIKPSVEELKKQLREKIDADHDGSISKEEVKNYLLHKGIHGVSLRTWYAFWRYDSNHNGKLDDPKELDSFIDYAMKHCGGNLITK